MVDSGRRREQRGATSLADMALLRLYSQELVGTLFVHPYSRIEFLVNALAVERKAAS
jgi:hypothetical protein